MVTTNKHLAPPEVGVQLVQAMHGWLERHAGKMEQVWSFAGLQGGGGILNVDSAEELDQVMTEFPFAPFSETQIYPLTDIRASLDRVMAARQAMAPSRG